MLRGELRRAEPDADLEIHGRASVWHEARGELDRAIDHATAARDGDRAGVLLWRAAPSTQREGRAGALVRGSTGFDPAEIAARLGSRSRRPAVPRCRGPRARGALGGRGRTAADGRRAGLAAGLAFVRAAVARNGVTQMAEDAERA